MPDHDAELMARVQELLTAEMHVPPSVVAAAKAAFGWRRIDEELASLLADTAAEPALAARNDSRLPRQITCRGDAPRSNAKSASAA